LVPRDGHATVVVAPDDEQLGAELSRCAQIGTGVAVVRPVPRVATRGDVAPDVLMAMGKHFDCLDRERRRPRAWDLAALWLRAERVRHLVIAHADHVAIFLWQDFSDLARAAGADLWLVVGDTSRSRSTPTVMGDVALRWSDAGSLLKALPQAVPDPAPYRPLAMPLPDDDFLTFRSSCRSLLSADRFAEVDEVYRQAYRRTAAQEWITDAGEIESFETVATYLDRLTAGARSLGECLVQLRAAQAALFAVSILVRLSRAPAHKHVMASLALTEAVAGRLRRLVTPELCAAGALSAAGADWRLRMADVGRGRNADIGIVASLPMHARPLVRVQILARRLDGAKGPDPLLVNTVGTPANKTQFGRMAARAVSLATLGQTVESAPPSRGAMPLGGWLVSSVGQVSVPEITRAQ